MVALAISMVVYLYLPRALPAKPLSFQLISHRGVHQTFPLENLQNDTKVYVADVDTPEDLEKVRGLPIDGIVTNRIEAIGPILKR